MKIERMILVGRMVKRFKMETQKQSGKNTKNWNVFQCDPLWKACEKAVDLCERNGWDHTIFLKSRFEKLGPWAQKKFKVKSLPMRLLCSPRAEEIYNEYVAVLQDMYRESFSEYVDGSLDLIKCQMVDSWYIVKKLKIPSEKYEEFKEWLAPVFLATSKEVANRALTSGSLGENYLPQEVIDFWLNMNDLEFDKLVNLRKEAKEVVGV